jgi:hypothetical protein
MNWRLAALLKQLKRLKKCRALFIILMLEGDLTDVQMTVYEIARFEVLRAVRMEMQIFWDITPCRLVNIY